jgi:hypothetical protein
LIARIDDQTATKEQKQLQQKAFCEHSLQAVASAVALPDADSGRQRETIARFERQREGESGGHSARSTSSNRTVSKPMTPSKWSTTQSSSAALDREEPRRRSRVSNGHSNEKEPPDAFRGRETSVSNSGTRKLSEYLQPGKRNASNWRKSGSHSRRRLPLMPRGRSLFGGCPVPRQMGGPEHRGGRVRTKAHRSTKSESQGFPGDEE